MQAFIHIMSLLTGAAHVLVVHDSAGGAEKRAGELKSRAVRAMFVVPRSPCHVRAVPCSCRAMFACYAMFVPCSSCHVRRAMFVPHSSERRPSPPHLPSSAISLPHPALVFAGCVPLRVLVDYRCSLLSTGRHLACCSVQEASYCLV